MGGAGRSALPSVTKGNNVMRDLSALGARPWAGRPFKGFPDAVLRDFESIFAISLPGDYVQFLRFANGGILDVCEYVDPVTNGIGVLNDFYGLGSRGTNEEMSKTGKWQYGNLWGETRSFNLNLLKGGRTLGVPFARDGGGNKCFLDYRDSLPCVSRLVVSTLHQYQLAPTFSAFLDLLRPATRQSNELVKGQKSHKFRLGNPD